MNGTKYPVFRMLLLLVLSGLTVGGADHLYKEPSDNLLRAEYGAFFRPMGLLQVASDKFHVLIDIPIISFENVTQSLDVNLHCDKIPAEYKAEGLSTCLEYQRMFHNYQLDAYSYIRTIYNKMQDIDALIAETDTRRQKRGLFLPIIGGLISATMSAGNAYLTHKRINMLKDSIKLLAKNDYILKEQYLDLSQNLATLTQISDEEFGKLTAEIDRAHSRMAKLAESVTAQFATIADQLGNTTRKLTAVTRTISRLSSRGTSYITTNHKYYIQLLSTVQRFSDGLAQLSTGRLPKELVPPAQLRTILDHSASELYKIAPNLEFTFENLDYYYSAADTLYTVANKHVILDVEILLKAKNQEFMDLYQIQTCHVPFNMTDTETHETAHTRLDVEQPYFGVLDNNFVRLSEAQLARCKRYGILHVCEEKLLQVNKSKLDCIAALFWNYKASTIQELCNFSFYNKIKPTPCVLDGGDNILLAGFDTNWSLHCRNKAAVPTRYVGHKYAVLRRSVLCMCSLMSQNTFLAAHYTNCNSSVDSLRPRFVQNAAVVATFSDHPDDFNIHNLYDNIPEYKVPIVQLTETDSANVLITEDSGSAKLKRLKKLLDNNSKIFLSKQDQSDAMSNMNSWFSDHKFLSLGISFLMSILGAIGLVVSIFACYKTLKLPWIAGALLTAQAPLADAMPTCPTTVSDTSGQWTPKITLLAIHLGLTITLYFSYKCLKRIYKRCTILRVMVPFQSKYKDTRSCDIFIEINSAIESCCLYLCSISANSADVHINGYLSPNIIQANLRFIFGYLSLNWNTNKFMIYVSKTRLPLPTRLHVPLWNVMKTKRILQGPFVLRTLIGQHGLFTELGRHSHNYIITKPLKTENNEILLTSIKRNSSDTELD